MKKNTLHTLAITLTLASVAAPEFVQADILSDVRKQAQKQAQKIVSQPFNQAQQVQKQAQQFAPRPQQVQKQIQQQVQPVQRQVQQQVRSVQQQVRNVPQQAQQVQNQVQQFVQPVQRQAQQQVQQHAQQQLNVVRRQAESLPRVITKPVLAPNTQQVQRSVQNVANGLRRVDPTNPRSVTAGTLRKMDPTNPNSLASKITRKYDPTNPGSVLSPNRIKLGTNPVSNNGGLITTETTINEPNNTGISTAPVATPSNPGTDLVVFTTPDNHTTTSTIEEQVVTVSESGYDDSNSVSPVAASESDSAVMPEANELLDGKDVMTFSGEPVPASTAEDCRLRYQKTILSCPRDLTSTIAYSINDTSFQISGGNRQTLPVDQQWIINFDRLNGKGTATYALTPGKHFVFSQKDGSYDLASRTHKITIANPSSKGSFNVVAMNELLSLPAGEAFELESDLPLSIGFDGGNGQVIYRELSRGDYQIGINAHTKLWDIFAK